MKALNAHIEGGLLEEHDEAIHGPLEWLFYGQFIEKPGRPGEYRIMGDFKELNNRIQKLYYDIMMPDNIWKKIKPQSSLYFVCDATSSYNQIKCSKETTNMMAVALPTDSGTKYYHFRTAGQGCSNSGPAWCQASDEVLKGVVVVSVEKGVDDCLIQAKTEEELIKKKFQNIMKNTFILICTICN